MMSAAAFPAVGYDADLPSIVEEGPSAHLLDVEPQLEDENLQSEDGGDAVKVVVRVRPPLQRELQGYRPYDPATLVDPTRRGITLSENLRAAANDGVENGMVYNTYRFSFDRVYGPDARQQQIYEESARGAVNNVLQGYNASIIAFGQTGAGKTYTMAGDLAGEGRGIIPRAIEDVFTHIQRDTGERCKFLVRASYLQIYNEVISDLLKPSAPASLTIREDRRRGVHVEGLSEWVVRTPADVYSLMESGAAARTTGATKLNELSSRSHAIFILIVEKSSLEAEAGGGGQGAAAATAAHMASLEGGGGAGAAVRQTVRVGKLNLVDLAGSERVHLTGATGKRLEESKKINQSLSALGNVIAALTDPKGRGGRPHIPYRDSKLTRILEDSLGGNCKTTFMAMVSPAVEAYPESLSTLKFAHRAKCVRNAAVVNEDLDHRTLLRKYERELKRLRAELQQRSKDLVDKRLVLQIEEARRREQADKIAAISALERQSAEIARQKAAMAALQHRIASMQSQLLVGGQRLEETPQFRTLLAREQARIREQYEARLADLEVERGAVAEGRAAAERLKGLLLKQRDVMVALTQRLTERDAEVLALQAEVEGGEGRLKVLEDELDLKTAELIALRKAAAEGANGRVLDGAVDVKAGRHEERSGDEQGGGWSILASPARGVRMLPGPQEVGHIGSGNGSSEDGEGSPAALHRKVPASAKLLHFSASPDADGSGGGSAHAAGAAAAAHPHSAEDAAASAAAEMTRRRCEVLAAERQALRSILSSRVLASVTAMDRCLDELGDADSNSARQLGKQLTFLRQLVAATVLAMEDK